MVKRDKNAHQSNHYKATHNSGGKANKKSGGKAKKGNKSINKFLGIGKPGPHLLKHRKQQALKKPSSASSSSPSLPSSTNKGKKSFAHKQQQPQQQHQHQHQHQKPGIRRANREKRAALLKAQQEYHDRNKSDYNDTQNINSNYNYYNNLNNNMTNDDASTSSSAPKTPQHHHDRRDPVAHAGIIDVDEYEADLAYVYQEDPQQMKLAQATAKKLAAESTMDSDYNISSAATSSAVSTASSTPEPSSIVTPAERQAKLEKAKLKKQERKKRRKQEKALQKANRVAERKELKAAKGRADKDNDDYDDDDDDGYLSPVLRPIDAESAFVYSDPSQQQPPTQARTTNTSRSKAAAATGDDMQNGADFIGFGFSDDEPEETAEAIQSQPHGEKRKRDADDGGSDAEGSTGPPPGCPWMGHRQYSKMPSVPIMLTQELKDFVDFIGPTREEHQVREYAFRRIKEAVQSLWPDSTLEIFGSFTTRLYLPSSDLDLVVLRRREFAKNDLYKLSSHLRERGVAEDMTVIAKARVPIVKCRETISGLPIDISFNITNGIDSARIVNQYMEEVPALRPMTLLIKHFLMIKGYNEVFNGGIGSYTTMIMILSFLQMHPQVQTGMIDAEENLGVLLIEFFELYGMCYNYSRVGLSVMNGGAYFVKTGGQTQMRGGRPELLLSSIDPNDVENDTARGSYQLNKIREVFVGAYGTLTNNMQERHRVLFRGGASDPKSKHYRFDDHNRVPADSVEKSSGVHHHEQVSLIKGVMSVPLDVMNHRRHVESIFYEGRFQQLFGDPPGLRGLDQIEGRR
ncbi:hypothetical protein BGZ83_010765 [Gryganskiella cystojenkinii]|nr:hypothetical protein BGZ83_010765 [Gryganskiella cystojenkinii]